jgi:hypothetical protein
MFEYIIHFALFDLKYRNWQFLDKLLTFGLFTIGIKDDEMMDWGLANMSC